MLGRPVPFFQCFAVFCNQTLQENICVGVAFFIKLENEDSYFSVNFVAEYWKTLQKRGKDRNSHQRYSIKKKLKNFAIFTGKHLCLSLFNKVFLIKKRLQHKCFPVNIVKFLRTPILKNIFIQLLLKRPP